MATPFCPYCGRSLDEDRTRTQQAQGGARPRPAPERPYDSGINGSHSGGRTAPLPGFQLPYSLGPYTLKRRIGKGGFSVVYEADAQFHSQPIAVKIIPANDQHLIDAIQAEFAARSRILSFDHVVRAWQPTLEHSDLGDFVAYPMELMDADLKSVVSRLARLGPRKREETTLTQWLPQICRGVIACHEAGILHLDLKPANVLLDASSVSLKVSDFGVSKVVRATILARKGNGTATSGTPGYMAPEQEQGSSLSVRTDIYAIGVLLQEMMTGSRRLNTLTGSSVADALIARCTETDPRRRFRSVASLLDEVHEARNRRASSGTRSSEREKQNMEGQTVDLTGDFSATIPLVDPGSGGVGTSERVFSRELVIKRGILEDRGEVLDRSTFQSRLSGQRLAKTFHRVDTSAIEYATFFRKLRPTFLLFLIAMPTMVLALFLGWFTYTFLEVFAFFLLPVSMLLEWSRRRSQTPLYRPWKYGFFLITKNGVLGEYSIRRHQIQAVVRFFGSDGSHRKMA